MHRKKILNKLLLFVITVPVLLFIYLPILWLFFSSLSNPVELLAIPPHWIPQNPTFQNYIDISSPILAASAVPRTFAASMVNSLKVSLSVTAISLVLGGLAAYALARIRFKGKSQVLLGILGTRMIPEISLVHPALPAGFQPENDQHAAGVDHHLPQLCSALRHLDVNHLFPDHSHRTGRSCPAGRVQPHSIPDQGSAACVRPGNHHHWLVRLHARLGRILLRPYLHQHTGSQNCASRHFGICGAVRGQHHRHDGGRHPGSRTAGSAGAHLPTLHCSWVNGRVREGLIFWRKPGYVPWRPPRVCIFQLLEVNLIYTSIDEVNHVQSI